MSEQLEAGRASGHSCARGTTAVTLLLAALMVAVFGCSELDEYGARFKDRSTEFAAIQVGTHGANRQTVVAAMGAPLSSHVANFGGIVDAECVEFRDRNLRYQIIFVGNKVWFKVATPILYNSRKEAPRV